MPADSSSVIGVEPRYLSPLYMSVAVGELTASDPVLIAATTVAGRFGTGLGLGGTPADGGVVDGGVVIGTELMSALGMNALAATGSFGAAGKALAGVNSL